MNTTPTTYLAALLAVCATSARAQERAQGQNLTRPISTVEFGIGNVSNGSFKAGEYNGLEKKGRLGIGNFNLRGGGSYDSDNTVRWRVKGVDLGLEGRNVYAEVGAQGTSRLTFEFDQLQRNRSDSFQTIFDGVGTNVLALPGAWMLPTVAGSTSTNSATNITSARGLVPAMATAPYVNLNTGAATFGGVIAPTATQVALTNAAAATNLGFFRSVAISTRRTRFDVALDYQFTPHWDVAMSFRPEHKDGLKPMSVTSRASGGDISATIPDVVDADHNQVSAALAFKTPKTFLQAGYNGSFYRNRVPSLSFQNWALGPTVAISNSTMSTAPDNDFSQMHLTGGYHPSAATHLTADASYGRATQNDPFLTDASTPVVPVSSLNGVVVTTTLNAKVSARPAKRLQVTGGYKYNDRDNQTAVHIFQFMDAEQPLAANPAFAPGSVLATNVGANRSYSQRLNQANGDLDVKLTSWQSVKAGYEFQKIDRTCPGSWIDCSNAAVTDEHTGRADWRLAVRNDVVVRAGYAYSSRRGPYNENSFLAIVPYANVSPMAATGGMTYYKYLVQNGMNGWGPALPFAVTTGNANVFFPANSETHLSAYAWENRIAELPGLRRYEVADRNRGKLRASLDWQATEEVSFEVSVDHDKSDFINSRYGMLGSQVGAVTFDGTYVLGDLSANVFYTYEDLRSNSAGNTYTVNSNGTNVNGATGLSGLDGCANWATLQQRNNNAKLDPCLDWTTDRRDLVHSTGFGLGKTVGPLGLTANLVASRARSDNTPTGGNYANNIRIGPGAAPTNIGAFYIPATSLPTVTTNTAELRVDGRYAIGPRMSVRLGYLYQWMQSDDYAYEGLQLGVGTAVNVLPTNESAFNHSVHVFGASYIFSF